MKAIALEGENTEDKTISGENGGGGGIRRVCWPGSQEKTTKEEVSDASEESEKERSEK